MHQANTSLSEALSVVAGPPFVQLDQNVFKMCCTIKYRTSLVQNANAQDLSTWIPRNTHVFTLIKTAGDTVIYCHDNDLAYLAAPSAKLAEYCPVGLGLLAHWCLDAQSDGTKAPHLLVFDIIDQGANDPGSRGERLRLLAPALPQPLCVLQWAGELRALEGFTLTLPHEVECTAALTNDPLVMHKHLRPNQALTDILTNLNKI